MNEFLTAVFGFIAGGGAGWVFRGRVDVRRRSQSQVAGDGASQFQVGDIGRDFKA